jgi:hypothetical protein
MFVGALPGSKLSLVQSRRADTPPAPAPAAHDCGHNNLTGKRSVDYAIGGFLASFCSGLSLGWWNSVRCPPRRQLAICLCPLTSRSLLPLVATRRPPLALQRPRPRSRHPAARLLCLYLALVPVALLDLPRLHHPLRCPGRLARPVPAPLLLPGHGLCPLQSRRQIVSSPRRLVRIALYPTLTSFPPPSPAATTTFKAKADNFRTFEVVGIVAYWCVPPGPVEEYAGALSLPPAAPYIARCWFIPLLKSMGSGLDGLINAVGFVLLWLCTLSAIHVQIVLSHSAVSDEDKGMYESFVVRQLRTTQDVACPESISVRLPRPPTSLHLPVREP